ncbi:MAG: SxtJ family membrane protein [Pseudomonadota bacterium]
MEQEIPELDSKGLRDFALTTGGIVMVLFGLVFPWLLDVKIPVWPWILGSALMFWGLIAPASLRRVYRLWMRFGLVMSKVMTPLILGIAFIVMFIPIGILMRLFGRDPMQRKIDPELFSYREHSAPTAPEDMERPF